MTAPRMFIPSYDGNDYSVEELQSGIAYLQAELNTRDLRIAPVRTHINPINDPRFTEQDREYIWHTALDEACDMSTKDVAEILLDGYELVDCVVELLDEDDREELASLLERVMSNDDEYCTVAYMREHEDDLKSQGVPHEHIDINRLFDFAKRMKLTNEDETEVTELGREFIAQCRL